MAELQTTASEDFEATSAERRVDVLKDAPPRLSWRVSVLVWTVGAVLAWGAVFAVVRAIV